MSIEEDNSVESFQDCGFTLLQAQHLSRLSINVCEHFLPQLEQWILSLEPLSLENKEIITTITINIIM